MKTIFDICVFALPLLLFGPMPANTTHSNQDDEQAVRAAANQFYAARNAMFSGDLEPMQQIWSHADDVTYMGPGGGFRVGWEAVLADWETQAAMNLGGEVHPEDLQITVGRDLAVVSNNEIGKNVGSAESRRRCRSAHERVPQGRRGLEDDRPPHRPASLHREVNAVSEVACCIAEKTSQPGQPNPGN